MLPFQHSVRSALTPILGYPCHLRRREINKLLYHQIHHLNCVQTVYNALKAGYRLLDGAGDYGNEKEAGEGLARAIKDGIVKREDVCE